MSDRDALLLIYHGMLCAGYLERDDKHWGQRATALAADARKILEHVNREALRLPAGAFPAPDAPPLPAASLPARNGQPS
jgi:hypothetical protein